MTSVCAAPAVAWVGSGVPIEDAEAGGKGAALARLAGDGFQIPPTALVTATAYIGINLLVDMVYGLVDPRIRNG